METFNSLDPMLKMFWLIALPVSLIFLIQTVMTFIGADATDGLSADFDSNLDGADAPFQLFSFRNLVNFLLGLSWSGISFYETIPNKLVLVLVSFGVGTLFLLLFFVIIRQIQRLAEDNSFRMDNALNKTAEVYLTIPGEKKGKGKVMISVKGSYRELDAMCEGNTLPSGTLVKVVRLENGNVLIVEAI